MNNNMLNKIYKDKGMLFYLRMNPDWYRKLNRDPENYKTFKDVAKIEMKRTLNDTIDKIKTQVSLASIMLEYFKNNN